MAKIEISEELKGKELFKFLAENKNALIAQKKSMLKYADTVIHSATPIKRESVKAAGFYLQVRRYITFFLVVIYHANGKFIQP